MGGAKRNPSFGLFQTLPNPHCLCAISMGYASLHPSCKTNGMQVRDWYLWVGIYENSQSKSLEEALGLRLRGKVDISCSMAAT
jgi:hypothetical protein